MKYSEVTTINTSDQAWFDQQLNSFISEGWEIISANIGFVNSESYDYCGSYMALLGKTIIPHAITDEAINELAKKYIFGMAEEGSGSIYYAYFHGAQDMRERMKGREENNSIIH